MGELTSIKKYGEVYNLLSDLNEYKMLNELESKLKKKGYKVCVVRDKYKFKYHTDKCRGR